MDETYNTTGIVIKNEPWRENDSKVTIYTFDRGKLEMVARGTKKIKSKLAGHLEPATLVNLMVVHGRQLPYVGFAVSENPFSDIKENLSALIAVGKAFKILNDLVKTNESDVDLFFLIKEFLDSLDDKKTDGLKAELLFIFFVLKLLALLGYRPELSNCVVCKSKILANNKSKIDFTKGGLICPKCQGSSSQTILTISDNCIKILRIIIGQNLKKTLKIKINKNLQIEMKHLIDDYLKVF